MKMSFISIAFVCVCVCACVCVRKRHLCRLSFISIAFVCACACVSMRDVYEDCSLFPLPLCVYVYVCP